ncbi:hypothetical protein PLICRDRAFT_173034 [Plicaturopsis crispa FD-325 SS-3]|nr:hypothetical protein PLICRDRAFT_173034 [Plicaturopsis crispa FD-325 SS-3]
MQDSQQTFNWLQYAPHSSARPIDIKVESSAIDLSAFTLLSPPSSPSPRSVPDHSAPLSFAASNRRRANTSSVLSCSPQRVKPYPPASSRERRQRIDDHNSARMSNTPPFAAWASAGSSRSRQHLVADPVIPTRRSSDGDQQPPSYPLSHNTFVPSFPGRPSERNPRPQSSSSSAMATSSLTGAMGDAHLSRQSDSPSPTNEPPYGLDMNTGMVWQHSHSHLPGGPPHSSSQPGYPAGVPGQGAYQHTLSSSGTAGAYLPYGNYNQSSSYNTLPPPPAQSHTSQSHSPTYPYPDAYQPNRSQISVQTRAGPSGLQTPDSYPAGDESMNLCEPSPISSMPDDEVRRLQRKVRGLELINESASQRIRELELELANDLSVPSSSTSSSYPPSSSATANIAGGLPSPLSTPSPQSATFQASWRARTDARIRQFCSLNRAGNALCAWHDSRRERRAHPPRMAPPGHLNCGCTYEEALFEESLARHGVGSYHPGETVRMDPALRNPLLKLLEQRYAYKDGDFERDPVTGGWVEGEGHQFWEGRVQAGAPHTRKFRSDSDRH